MESYTMKVLTDDVEEIQIGNLSKWKHKLKTN